MKYLMTYEQKPNLPPPTPQKMAALGAFVDRMRRSGALIMTGGLVRPTKGIKVVCEGGKISVTDGPFAESKELIDGYALIEAASIEEAIRQATEFMEVAGDGKGEILQVFDPPTGP